MTAGDVAPGDVTADGEPAVVGLDVGTTAVKGAAYSLDGRLLAAARVPHPTVRRPGGVCEQRPGDWLRGIAGAWAQVAHQASFQPVAVGLTSQVNTHVFVGRDLAPLSDAITWQDTRCAPDAAELARPLRPADVKELWGGPFAIDASFALSRAAHVRRTDPRTWEATAWLMSPKDYVLAALTGEVVTDALSPVGLVGPDGGYLDGVLALVDGAAERLPPIRDFDALAGHTTGHVLPAGLPVAVGTMDAWANLFGSGVVARGQAMQVAGTSEILAVVSDVHVPTPGVITFHPVRGRIVHAGPTQSGGDALRWFAELHGASIDAVLAAAEAARRQPRDPLLFLPHLQGERAPVWNPDARAVWVGASSATTFGQLALSVLEGVAFASRRALEAVEVAAGGPATELRLSGGAAASPTWNQVKADVHGRPVAELENLDSGTFGAALMGGVAAGIYGDILRAADDVARIRRVFEPGRPRESYASLYRVYLDTYERLCQTFLDLSEVREAAT